MWILVVLVITLTDINVHVVDRYTTKEDCDTHKETLEVEFKVAYPNDRDYAFVCVLPNPK